ncbi:protein traN [Asticcacaulis biprosthecium C19]|uniref:Protein traN n=1 Tax=Asticcacaulis biprosthecium C19 TaxID=715226 RepID=F4QG41_9CAUL|nr:conjugal transfer protein TraN [Asticcacaulis biprosthecium]EGF93852.1 protein traN [Asticcacaulis biprosthecium C19]
MRCLASTALLLLVFFSQALAQTYQPPNLAEFRTALDRANSAAVSNDIAANMPGYQGAASDLQAKSGEEVATLQRDGAVASSTNVMKPAIVHSNAYVAANPVSENAAWVKGALGVANDPTPSAGGVTGTTSTTCHAQRGGTDQATIYTCESGNNVVTTSQACQTYQDIALTSATRTCQTDSYYEAQASYANIGDFTEAHQCVIFAGPGGLNTGIGCGVMISQINGGNCAPPKQIGSTSNYLQYCKTAYTGITGITYLGRKADTCSAQRADTGCTNSSEICSAWIDQASGTCGAKTVTYTCANAGYVDNGLNVTACAAFSGNPACTLGTSTCTQHASDVPDIMAALALPADFCLKSTLTYSCDSVASTGSNCEVPGGCVLKEQNCIDPNYDGSSPCQTYDHVYACQAAVVTPPSANGAICDSSWVNGTAIIATADDPDNDLPQALSAINALKEASGSYGSSGTLTIFGGDGLKCGKSIGGLSNCCKDSGLLLDANLTSCNADEKKLAAEQKKKACHYIGTYCSNKSLFGCLMKKMTYCCYGSVLGRIVEEAGHSQLGISWGDAKNPQCGGFSVSQFQQIDLSNVDFSDFYDDKLAQLADNDPNSTVAAITASINSMSTSRTPQK